VDSRKGLAEAARDVTTKVMTEVRVSERDMHTGEAGDGMRDTPTVMAMEMAMAIGRAVTPTAADTASTATLEATERNENGKQRRRIETLVSALGPGDWRSRVEQTVQQQPRKLSQLHRTIAKIANMWETQTALQEAQRRGMKTWMEEKE